MSWSILRLVWLFAVVSPAISTRAQNQEIWQPAPGTTWQIQFGQDEIDLDRNVEVYDLDGFDTSAGTVAALHARGARVLCYINAGVWEDWRPDADRYPESIIGNPWEEWEGERFLDIRQLDQLAPVLEARFDMCAEKGFDAIEPDNIDTFQNGEDITGFDLAEADQIRFNRWLADQAHARGLAIGQKNIPDLTATLEPDFDFAVTEDCFVDGWCDEVSAYPENEKAVFAIEYTDTGADLDVICPEAADLRFSVILKHRDLDAWSETCS